MEGKEHNLPPKDDPEATLIVPRFDEKAEETARPVVPLRRVADAPAAATRGAHGPSVATRGAWPRSLTLALVVVLAVMLGTAVAYRSSKRAAASTAPPPAAQQASTETTVGEAPSQPSTQKESKEVSNASTREPWRSEKNDEAAGRSEADRREDKEAERGKRDAEKRAERARKEEERARHEVEKTFERLRKEAEKMAERRGKEKGGEQKPRLVGVLTGQSKP